MKRKKWIAAALALLLTLTLAPAALAQELPFPADWFSGFGGGFSLRSLIDENRGDIEIAGSSVLLKNLIFYDEAVVDEDSEICLCETAENAMILDESALPEGLSAEVRKVKLRVPDGVDGEWVADAMRREKNGQPPAEKPEIDPADRDREAYYLFLTGKPREEGEYLFVLWDGAIRLCSVTVLSERPEPTAAPATEEHPSDPGVFTEQWVDTDEPMTLPGSEQNQPGDGGQTDSQTDSQTGGDQTGSGQNDDGQNSGVTETWIDDLTGSITDLFGYNQSEPTPPPTPASVFVLPNPSVSVTGASEIRQGDSAVLEARSANTYNPSYQWYVWDDAHQEWQPLSGATDSQYRPDSSETGVRAYLCEVTNNGPDGQTATAYGDPVIVTVEAKQTPPAPSVPTPTPTPEVVVPALPAPSVSIAGNTSSYTGERAVLEARASNAYNAGYQWYMGLGSNWQPITDGTGNSAQYKPDTSRPGSYAYLCRVTSSANGQQTYADSEPIVFTVADRPAATPTPVVNKTVSSVSVGKLPNKVEYNDGEAVDATGLQLRVRYSDGSSGVVDSGYIVTTQTVDYNSSGLATVNVNYRGFQTGYQVKVHSVAELVRGIGVLTMPNKSSYTVGEYLNTAGLSIRVYSYDGRYLDVSEGFTCSPTYFQSPGNQAVTVTFMGKTCTFNVAVQEARRVTGLTIQSLPANRSYTVGDTINTAGLVLQLQTTSGTETVTSGYSVSPRVATTAGSQQITVNYQGMSTSYTVDVRSNIPYATPSPSPAPFGVTPTPAPFGTVSPSPFGTVSPTPTAFPALSASASPMPTPIHTPTPARRNTGVSTAVKVLFAVAVLALGGLIGYVLYLRKADAADAEFLDEPGSGDKFQKIFSKSDKGKKR